MKACITSETSTASWTHQALSRSRMGDMPDMRFEQRMSDADALMWTIEKDPLLRSTITALALFDTSPDHGRLIEGLDRATRLVPRLRQRVVSKPLSIAPPRWEVDPRFDLGYHLR